MIVKLLIATITSEARIRSSPLAGLGRRWAVTLKEYY